MILSVSVGILATTPLLMAELHITPWVTRVQGPTAPLNIEVVYANFTITDLDAPTPRTIDYCVVLNVTNPSEYRTILSMIDFYAAQEVHGGRSRTPQIDFMNGTSDACFGEAKGAWVDGIYYNVTLTAPYPYFDNDGTIIHGYSTFTEEELYTYYNKWMEGVQYCKYYFKESTGINTYTYLNMNGTWVDVTGRITLDGAISEDMGVYTSSGTITTRYVHYLGSGSKMNKDNEFNCFFEPGESRLLVFSGKNYRLFLGDDINPIDVIQSGTVQILALTQSFVDIEPIGENNTFIETGAETAEIQELVLTQIGNSYLYNTVLSENQMFQLDKYGLEVFIVPVR